MFLPITTIFEMRFDAFCRHFDVFCVAQPVTIGYAEREV